MRPFPPPPGRVPSPGVGPVAAGVGTCPRGAPRVLCPLTHRPTSQRLSLTGRLCHTAGTCRWSQNSASAHGRLPNSSNQMEVPPPVEGEGLGSLGPTPAAGTLLSPRGPESWGPAAVGGSGHSSRPGSRSRSQAG